MPPRLAPPRPSFAANGPTTGDRISAATARIRRLWSQKPTVGLILGSGLHRLADAIETDVAVEFAELPGMLAPTAQGHKGRILCGWLAGLPVIACQGRLHGYEGHARKQLRFPVRLFDELGCETLVLSNAAGAVNPGYRVGDVMIVTDHVDLIGRPTLAGFLDRDADATSDANCYDSEFADIAYRLAVEAGRPVQQGTYAALNGPNYETRAEYRMLQTLGIDTVGMSTAPEADEARRRGLRVLALSTVTNVCDPDALGETSGDAVIAAAEAAESHVRGIVWDVLSHLQST